MSVRAGEWTIEDLADLPEDNNRYEIVEGQLLVTPPPPVQHQRIGSRLIVELARECPPEWTPTYESLLAYGRTGRVPDVLVVRTSAFSDAGKLAFTPSEIGLATEIVSTSSRRRDRIDKPAEYAAQGIPLMWRVEPEPDLVIHPFRLVRGEWRPLPVVQGHGSLPVPWGSLEVDLRPLTP